MKNTERVDLRLTPKTKGLLTKLSKESRQNCSEYIRSLIEQAACTGFSHQQQIYLTLKENKFINSLFANPELTDDAKMIIAKEMRKHV